MAFLEGRERGQTVFQLVRLLLELYAFYTLVLVLIPSAAVLKTASALYELASGILAPEGLL